MVQKSSSGTRLGPPQRGPNLNLLPWRYLILANGASPMLLGGTVGGTMPVYHQGSCRGAACPVTVLTSFSPPQSLGGRTLLGPGAVWAPVPVNGVAPEQRQPATQRSAPEFL